ncbi:hypothetical protein EMF73_30470 [Klebsiella pneumoniae]|nr:hypothetical protein EMF73_30470 [Klebsiella pneumoniae]
MLNVSRAELILADMLRARGRVCIPQKAVGPYNVDIATGSVAVEVLGGAWHRTKRHGERLRHLLDCGWNVLYVWVDGIHYPLTPEAAEHIVAFAKVCDGTPAGPRRYRVIRGSGEFVAQGSADDDQLPDKVPLSSRPERPPASVPFGYCHCGCGRTTGVSRGHHGTPRGFPNRYVNGHNNSR